MSHKSSHKSCWIRNDGWSCKCMGRRINVTISIGVRREEKLPKYFFHLQLMRYALNF